MLCYLCQRYNLKANHIFPLTIEITGTVVLSMSKIQSESKSQQILCSRPETMVVLSMSKIQSESKSQHDDRSIDLDASCVIYVKDTI